MQCWCFAGVDVIRRALSEIWSLHLPACARGSFSPVDLQDFMNRQMEKILLTLNCSSFKELLWQGGAPITRNSSCVLFTKRPKAMFVSIETVATLSLSFSLSIFRSLSVALSPCRLSLMKKLLLVLNVQALHCLLFFIGRLFPFISFSTASNSSSCFKG